MRLKVTICIMLILSGCAALQEQKLPKEVDIPVTETAEPLEITEDGVDAQLHEDNRERIITLFDDALARMGYAPQNAVTLYKEIIQIAPNRWEVYYNLGIIYMRRHDTEKAIKKFFAALKHRAPPAKIYNTIGMAYLTMGEERKAINMFEKVLSYKESPSAMINIANIYQGMDQTDKAIKYYREAEVIEPSSQILHYNIGTLLYKMGDYKGAEEEFSKALSYGGRKGRILLSKAQTFLRLREYEAALKIFQEIVAEEPVDSAFYRDKGIIYEVYLGDMEKALDSYTSYVERGGEKKEEVKVWIDVVRAKLGSKEEEE